MKKFDFVIQPDHGGEIPVIENGVVRYYSDKWKDEKGNYRSVLEWNAVFIDGIRRPNYLGLNDDFRIVRMVQEVVAGEATATPEFRARFSYYFEKYGQAGGNI